MDTSTTHAAHLHENVPPDWYYASMKRNLLQRYWHSTRFRVVGNLIEPTGGRILDIGCADGMFTNVILTKSKANNVIGIDVLKSSIDWANNHWRSKKVSFRKGNAHKLNFKDQTFDAVFALEVLEHVSDPKNVFKEVKRVLKKGGYFISLVPTDNFLFRVIWLFVTKFWWARIWDHTHVQSFNSTNTLADNLRKSGFAIEVDKTFMLGMLNVVKVRKTQ